MKKCCGNCDWRLKQTNTCYKTGTNHKGEHRPIYLGWICDEWTPETDDPEDWARKLNYRPAEEVQDEAA